MECSGLGIGNLNKLGESYAFKWAFDVAKVLQVYILPSGICY